MCVSFFIRGIFKPLAFLVVHLFSSKVFFEPLAFLCVPLFIGDHFKPLPFLGVTLFSSEVFLSLLDF
jgi:hypothetical protein